MPYVFIGRWENQWVAKGQQKPDETTNTVQVYNTNR